jgi:outer membrane protein insertion porin family
MSDGFGAYLGYPIYGFWSLSTGVSRDSTKMLAFEPRFGRSVVEYYAKYGTHASKFMNVSENAVTVNLSRDLRVGSIIPSGGSKISLGARFSGFGGDVALSRYNGEITYYRSLFWKTILKVKTSGTILAEWGGNPIPFDRRLLLGGIASIRGYQYGQIGPIDRWGSPIGGDRSLFANLEYLAPLPYLEKTNLNVVAFFDAGNAWNAGDSPFMKKVKMGAGLGIRWLSPMGPIRLEYGWKVIPEKGLPRGAFGFAMGQLF